MRGEVIVYLCGVHSLAFALFHLAFWKLFGWPGALQQAGVGTRAVTQILNLRLIYVFLGVATLCFAMPRDLLGTPLGHALLGGMSLFWVGRLVEQFVFLRHNILLVHALTASFVLGAVLFALPLVPGLAA
ncbi:hypothetical protein ACVCL0_10110 [Rhodanobacter sp. UC4450_H17]